VTHFEFLLIAVSIVIGLSITRLLEGLRDTFDRRRRYWIHAVWVICKIVNALLVFWAGWVLRSEIESWNFAQFVISLGPPGIVFLQAHALVTAHPDQVSDWRAHFWEIRRWLFGANLLLPLYNVLALYVIAGRPFPSPELAPLTLILVLSVVGLVTTKERIHGVIAILYLLALTLGLGTIFALSG